MLQPQELYRKKIDQYTARIRELEKTGQRISNFRLLISLGGLGLIIYLYLQGKTNASATVFIITAAAFVFFVLRHQQLKRELKQVQALLQINQKSLDRLSEDWTHFPDTGSEFIEDSHPYVVDLDIFGKRSLFQLMNTTNTFLGRQKLKEFLMVPMDDQDQLQKRQEMIYELGDHLDFRQRLEGEGMLSPSIDKNPEELFHWAGIYDNRWNRPFLRPLLYLSPAVLILLTVFSLLQPQLIPVYLPLSLFILHGLVLYYFSKDTAPAFAVAEKYHQHMKTFQEMITIFEKEKFSSPQLKKMQYQLRGENNQPAFQQIEKLGQGVKKTYIRHHQLYLIFNLFTLWDFQAMTALERWKKESGPDLKNWLSILGEVEALSSCAVLAYDHPDWCTPVIKSENFGIKAKALGHPLLLSSTRVANDVEISRPGEVLLITGSNMSGKSTFLRTIGINLVLAYMGCPVCAKDFQGSFFKIYSSMRINDNLDTGTSSFFAELLRIKTILQETEQGIPVLFLLDEIFKGTNSRDRHTGAKHLIKKLSRTGSIGLVSTHDLELGDLAKEGTQIKNYHFAEYYQNGKIYFDYKIKPGVSTTRNAIFLMKMAGIDITEE
ncbi:MutS family DNA mismatch repair protein [Dehalobacterium formicoaceticum]|uniref:MutS family DNA mismatch repair protein n=1 Tax=Dehalobacterium formicoaceticum TaxID=51515 RepID=UPI000B7F7EDD|nr:MutS family DNA mismatch repair protein [Dehalobacterium formicoaceticum]